jgi:hypothetical protein
VLRRTFLSKTSKKTQEQEDNMSSYKKRSREKDTEIPDAQKKYQKLFKKTVPNKFKNNLGWLKKQINDEITRRVVKTPATTTKMFVKRTPGSTENVKNLCHLLTQRSEFQGFKKVEKFNILIHKVTEAEEKEFAEIIKSRNVYLNFPSVKKDYEDAVEKVKAKKMERDALVADLPKFKRALNKAMEDMESMLEDCAPPLQAEIVKVFHETFEAKKKELAKRPLYSALNDVVNKYDEGERLFTLEEYEKRIADYDQRIHLFQAMLSNATGANTSFAEAGKKEAEQEKQAFQKKHGAAKKKKSAAKKKKFKGWATPNLTRKVMFIEEFQQRGLKAKEKKQASLPDDKGINGSSSSSSQKEEDDASSNAVGYGYYLNPFNLLRKK